MRPVHDWMALLRSGHKISAVGSSDSHTVNMAIVGQARTYIRCPDDAPYSIDIDTAVDSFLAGSTHVSFGLLTLLENTANGGIKVSVLGPGWSQAEKLTLFLDGRSVDSVTIPKDAGSRPGVKFERSWSPSDLGVNEAKGRFVVAVAEGPGIDEPWWRMMPPYQADTSKYQPYVMGISPAVWLKEKSN